MNLEALIAKFNLGELVISEFPKIAFEVLKSGVNSESLVILAGMNDRDNSFEIKEYLDCAIEELGISSHESINAAYVLANAYIESFKNEEIDIIECICSIKNECWDNCQNEIKSEKYLYDGIKFQQIIALWYEYCEIDEWTDWVRKSGKPVNQIKAEIENDLKEIILEWQSGYLKEELKNLRK